MAKIKQAQKLEAALFSAADKLRKNIDAAEYKHIVLGLVFLKYISDSFESLHKELLSQNEDAEDKDEYIAKNIFFVPQDSRWSALLSKAKAHKLAKI